MNTNKKIAVLVPAYNVEKFITEMFDSLLAQTYPYWECFCLDDGSTDSTYDMMKQYAAKDKRIHVFRHENRGVTKTSNKLLDMVDTSFDYIYHCDSDDCIHPQAFEIMVAVQQKTGVDVVETGICRGAEVPQSFSETVAVADLPVTVLTDMDIYLLRRTRKGLPSDNWITKRQLYVWDKVKNFRFNEQLSYEDDYFYNSQIHAHIRQKARVEYPLYLWRDNATSMTRSLNVRKYQQAGTARIYATHDYFIVDNRVPADLVREFKMDMADDAYRMIGVKPLRKCRDKKMRREMYENAGKVFRDMRTKDMLNTADLPWSKRLILWSFEKGNYPLTRFLLLFK